MSVGRICIRQVDLAESDESVQAVADRMNTRNVGTLVVLNESKEPIGILTDRDLAVRVVAQGREAYRTTVKEVMTQCPQTVSDDTPIEMALSVMRSGPYRRIPVVDKKGQLVGMLSLDDVLDLLSEEFNQVGQLIKKESPSRAGQI